MALANDRTVKGADYAREAVALVAGNPNEAARIATAEGAVRYGNYDADGKAVWQAYLDSGCRPISEHTPA